MAPSAIAEKPAVSQFTGASPTLEFLPIPERSPQQADQRLIPVKVHDLFKSSLIERNRITRGSRWKDVIVSVVLHVTIIAVPIFASLYYTDTLNLKQFTATFLVAPPPPPPPPPAALVVKTVAPRRVFMNQGRLVAPRYIPEKVAQIKEEPIPDSDFAGVAGGVPGGVPGGQMGGVIGGVIGGVMSAPLAPPTPKLKAPLRVGGRIRSPRPVYQPAPIYPVLARQAHVSGVVTVDAILDEQGNVVDMKILSGPPLLYPAALDALKHWKYEPTYLNDAPISVQMIVSITFQLHADGR